MAYFRKLEHTLAPLLELFRREERWMILISADPDALASAMALRRIMIHRVEQVAIAHVNEITRPDNLAMIRYLRIPCRRFDPASLKLFDRFAIVDSQPHHHPLFEGIQYSVLLDHHPLSEKHPAQATYSEIRPEYGANSTLLTEYLYALKIRPGTLLATALLYGIKTDTLSFERDFCDIDMRAFRWLSKFSDHALLRKIVRSEYRLEWLSSFGDAFETVRFAHHGGYVFLNEVDNPDILVALADFFMRVHDIAWMAVAGVYEERLVIIFRGDGQSRGLGDVGKLAGYLFGDLGSAGGHRAMARAEIPLDRLEGESADKLVWDRLYHKSRSQHAQAVQKKNDMV